MTEHEGGPVVGCFSLVAVILAAAALLGLAVKVFLWVVR